MRYSGSSQAAPAPLLDDEVQLLQVLIQRLLAVEHDPALPRGRRRRGVAVRQRQRAVLLKQITAVGRAVDALQRALKTRQALAADSPSELFQLLDEAAQYMDLPPLPVEQPADAHDEQGAPPSDTPTFTPLKTYSDPP